MNAIVCLDIGDSRIGIAFSEGDTDFVFPLKTYTRTKSIKADVRAIETEIILLNGTKVVIGEPVNSDNAQHGKNKEFADRLIRRCKDIEFVYFNEAFSTLEAEKELIFMDKSRNKRKQVVDQLAAVMILESYLSSCKNS